MGFNFLAEQKEILDEPYSQRDWLTQTRVVSEIDGEYFKGATRERIETNSVQYNSYLII